MADKQVNRWLDKKVGESDVILIGHGPWLNGETIANVTAVSSDTAKVTVGTAIVTVADLTAPADSGNPDGPEVPVLTGEGTLTPYDVIGGIANDIVYLDITVTSSNADRVDIETVGIRIAG